MRYFLLLPPLGAQNLRKEKQKIALLQKKLKEEKEGREMALQAPRSEK